MCKEWVKSKIECVKGQIECVRDKIELIRMKIRCVKTKINKLKRKYIGKVGRDVAYFNKPIRENSVDEIGVNTYVEHLESAIENDADIISIVSGFGTGKSSLIELLKERYNGWEDKNKDKNKKRYKRVYCQINLWSQLKERDNEKDEDKYQEHTLELHRTFLYQLISTIYPYKGSYISRRMGRNFGMLKISTENPLWNVLIHFAVIVFAFVSIVRSFSEQIITSEILTDKTLSNITILGYTFCAVIILLLLIRTEIIFSSKNSEGNRKIEENELVDLYRQHVLIPNRWFEFLLNVIRGKRHFVVVIEDLDRTQEANSVYHFLKEMRKYYIPSELIEKAFVNKVTFIVNIMPEALLKGKIVEPQEQKENIYDKIFDYSIHLNKVNIDNFDSILDALLLEKENELIELGIEIKKEDNVHEIPGMQWIVYGKELSLRQVKTRLNDAVLTYESIMKKFGKEYADFEKCACVAYLRNVFQEQFYQIEDRKLDEMVVWYTKERGNEQEFIDKFLKENLKEKDFLKTLYILIKSHLIDGNYRIYFYNYPKGSKLYNMQETRVRNLILYNEELTTESESDIIRVVDDHPNVIIEALETALELVKQLPEIVLWSKGLWEVANNHFEDKLDELLLSRFDSIEKLQEEHYNIIDSVIKLEGGSQLLIKAMMLNEFTVINEFRKYILEKHINYTSHFVELYSLADLPLSNNELNRMTGVALEHILDMVKGVVSELEREVVDGICVRVLNEKNESNKKKALAFYEELIETWEIASIVNNLIDYVSSIKTLPEKIDDAIYEGVLEGEVKAKSYFEVTNILPVSEIESKQLERISRLDVPGSISEEICRMMKTSGFISDYLLNMIVSNSSLIDLEWFDVQNVMRNEGEEIWKKHPEIFVKLRQWACAQFKDEMEQLGEFFKAPYPIISSDEAKNIKLLETMLNLYDVKRAEQDQEDTFVNFCNRQFRKSEAAHAIFLFIAKMEETIIPKVFYKLDMKKVRFSLMSTTKKEYIVEALRMPLKLTTPQEIIRFMNFTGSLIPTLERELFEDLKKKGNDDLCITYIKIIQEYGKTTRETIKNICVMPTIYAYGDIINEELYKKKFYKKYVCSKTHENDMFIIEYEKLETLWEIYLSIFKSVSGYAYTKPKMCKNLDFLKMVQNRRAYKELPEDSQMAMANIAQDEETLTNVLNYSDDFVVKYYSNIVGFASKDAATVFVEIMQKHQKYAQNVAIYNNVYSKLENSQLKRKYTKLYNKANS